jgi:D-glycero-D-manno-heptose 1,7-bisphosphate phosphatase
MSSKAVFLDRDGTIIEDHGYVRDPEQVTLLPGAGEAIRKLADAGNLIVVVSNQSGVARGLFDEATLDRVHQRMEELLREHHAPLHGVYYCPYLDGPEAVVESYRQKSELRKPGDGMLRQAASDLDIDLSQSWMIGDSATDVQAGVRAGCQTILIQRNGAVSKLPVNPTHRVKTLAEAAEILEPKSKTVHPPDAQKQPISSDRTAALLEQISQQIDRAQRTRRQNDFSVLRLIGALLQMFAIVAAVWGTIALVEDATGFAVARILLAIFLQVASLTALAVDRFR